MRSFRHLFLPLAVALLLPVAPSAKDPKRGSDKARWPIKTSLPSGTDLSKATPVSLSDLLALAPAAEHADTAHEKERYPKTSGAKAGEGQIVSTKGYLRLVAFEDDGDFHIQLTETPDGFDNCLIVEVPLNNADFVGEQDVMDAAKTVRAWVIHNLLKDAEPGLDSVHVIQGQAYVTVTGQLFFDSEHQAAMADGKFRGKSIAGKQLPSKTSWELHPVTAITFAPKPKT